MTVARTAALPQVARTLDPARLSWGWPLAMLISRALLFALAQAAIAVALAVRGTLHPWGASAAWWPVAAVLANVVTLFLLRWLFSREGIHLRDVFAYDRQHVLRDILITVAALAIGTPLAMLPNIGAAQLLFGDSTTALALFIRPLPIWAAYVSVVIFPLTVGLVELPTYFGYCMPRLQALSGKWWIALLLAGFFLAAQHMALPLIFDWRFLLWRLVMFLPFALFVGGVLLWKPRLLPWCMIGHALADLQIALMILAASR